MTRKLILSLMASTIALSTAALADTTAITGGTVWTGTGTEPIENGVVILIDDEVTAVGDDNLAIPAGATIVDASGSWVTPGIFAPFTKVGLVEVGAEDATNDVSAANSPYSASINAADAFNPSASSVPVTRLEGVTRMAVAPGFGQSLFAGQGFIAATSGEPDSVMQERAFTYIALGEGGAARAGGSRPAAWAQLRAALDDARNFTSRYITNPTGAALSRADADALGPAARGEQLILVAMHRASDIRRLIAFANDNPRLQFAIVGAAEGWIVADELAAADIPVIIDPFDNLPASFEQLGATSRNAERLIEAGVKTAFGHLGDDSHQTRLVLQSAGNAVANGLDPADAIKAITSTPADIFGLSDYGRLSSGASADVVIWDGDPLDVTSAPTTVIIGGVEQVMESRQTKLRDRYLDLTEDFGDLPLAYKRGG